MTDDLRTRIAAAVREHQQGQEWGIPQDECGCGWSSRTNEIDYADHLADAVIRELGPIPDRIHVDDQGRTWEWCGGEPETWAWRITRLDSR